MAGTSVSLFFARLRESGFQLGLDPEFGIVERLVLCHPEERPAILRECIDQFYWARGFSTFSEIQQAAARENSDSVVQALTSVRAWIDSFFKQQFIKMEIGQVMPQAELLKEVVRLFNEYDSGGVSKIIHENLELFDGHFFMLLSESLRKARASGHAPSLVVLNFLGKSVAQARLAQGLPCAFGALYGL